jgi:hypothetical protein
VGRPILAAAAFRRLFAAAKTAQLNRVHYASLQSEGELNMKALKRGLISMIGAIAVFAGTAVAQPVVVTGTGDPNQDVPAVQAAVDQGGRVVLTGHFSFDRPPAAPAGSIYNRMVTVSKKVVISGSPDQNGAMPTIQGGDWPFLVDAAGAHVTIEGLHFISPTSGAMWIYAVGGLVIANCRIESIVPSAEFGMEAGQANPTSGAIFIGADPHPPAATTPGKPENFSGTLAILNNDIDVGVGATPDAQTLGIVMFNVGRSPDKEVDIYVSGNNIRNFTEVAINFRVIGGRASAQRNVIVTGATGGADAIRVVGSGSYLIAHNSIDCGWASGAATAVNVFSNSFSPEAGAIVVDNDVTMAAPDGTVFGATSAGISIGGFAQGNSVLNNRIRGRAGAALAVVVRNNGVPGNNSFVSNDLAGFQSSLADIFVDAGVTNTSVIGRQALVEDHGAGTVVVPMQ